ncbi:MAG: HAMP domain-containing sensor histidine kinase [Sulfurimonas sp.]
MFRDFRLNIFIYYIITVVAFLGFSYYFLAILSIINYYLFVFVLVCFIILSGIFISNLAVAPLIAYVQNLQNLSKETLHELNLPISTIETNTKMLSKNLDDEKSLKRIERINSACEMLKERYNELDYMIKMQSKENVREKFFLDELMQERVDFLSKIYPQMNFNLSLKQLEIFNDKKGLSKVIDNIIDNGVKYSLNSKKIEIKIEKNRLIIQDYGVGMDEVELVRIFDNYYQSNTDMQGYGIGLSMVKRHCDKNGTVLRFESTPNVGTKVELKFKKLQG